jgi:hypothetical protein
MTQADWIILFLKIGVVSGFISIVTWIWIYGRLVRWKFESIGWTLVAKSALLAGLLLVTALSLFFHFNRTTSYVAGWVDVALILLVSPVMFWRSAVWLRRSRKRDE